MIGELNKGKGERDTRAQATADERAAVPARARPRFELYLGPNKFSKAPQDKIPGAATDCLPRVRGVAREQSMAVGRNTSAWKTTRPDEQCDPHKCVVTSIKYLVYLINGCND